MPSIRIGLSTQFNLKNEQVGIGTTNPTEFLDVLGDIRSEGVAGGGGISTFREYQGFQQTQQGIANNIVIDNGTSGPFSSLAGEILITDETTVSSGSTVEVGKTKTLTATDRFAVPLGETNNRDNVPEAGTTRFNQDFGTLEFFDGASWKTVNSYSRGGAAGRGLFGGGQDPSAISGIDVLNIISLGNSNNFGDLSVVRRTPGACSSEIRGLFGGGSTPSNSDVIDYVTIASEGNAIDFGNLTASTDQVTACSSSTRGLFGGGESPSITNVISYVEISTTGNSLDFGDLSENKRGHSGMASATRGFFCGGNNPGSTAVIDFVKIASKGNAVIFGNDITNAPGTASSSNSQKGVLYSFDGVSQKNISSITLASEGNAIYFGDLSIAATRMSATGSQTRSVILLGEVSPFAPTYVNTVEFVLYSSSGNSQDFGDLSREAKSRGALSDSHGGLGGF